MHTNFISLSIRTYVRTYTSISLSLAETFIHTRKTYVVLYAYPSITVSPPIYVSVRRSLYLYLSTIALALRLV